MLEDNGGSFRGAEFFRKNSSVIIIIICALLSVLFINTGLLSFLFLVPVSFAAFYSASFFLTACITSAVYILSFFIRGLFLPQASFIIPEMLYFTVLIIGIAWISSPQQVFSGKLRTLYKAIIVSAAAALVFIFMYILRVSSGFSAILYEQARLISEIFLLTSGDDAVRLSSLRQTFTPETIVETFNSVSLRGAAFFSMFFMIFISYSIALFVFCIVKRRERARILANFYAPPACVWYFSGSLALILVSRLFLPGIFEIAAWNVFTVCATIFTAQGVGITFCFLAKRSFGLRFFLSVLIIILIFSPAVVIALALFLLLGIAEIWLPLRKRLAEKAG